MNHNTSSSRVKRVYDIATRSGLPGLPLQFYVERRRKKNGVRFRQIRFIDGPTFRISDDGRAWRRTDGTYRRIPTDDLHSPPKRKYADDENKCLVFAVVSGRGMFIPLRRITGMLFIKRLRRSCREGRVLHVVQRTTDMQWHDFDAGKLTCSSRFSRCPQFFGVQNGNATLNPRKVGEIKWLLARDRDSMSAIARRYKVSHGCIRKIKLGKTWKDVRLLRPTRVMRRKRDDVERIKELRADGWSVRQIAAYVKRSVGYVHKVISR